MGKAIIIYDLEFATNLGSVTPSAIIRVTDLSVNLNSSYSAEYVQASVSYIPSNTDQKDVVWSLTADTVCAAIDASGLISIFSNATDASVTVRAASAIDPSIYSDAHTTLNYSSSTNILTAISINGDTSVCNSSSYTITYDPSTTAKHGVVWSVSDGAAYATVDQTGKVTALEDSSASEVVLKATSSYDPSIFATKTIYVTKDWWNLQGNVAYVPCPAFTDSSITILMEYFGTPEMYAGSDNALMAVTSRQATQLSAMTGLQFYSNNSRLYPVWMNTPTENITNQQRYYTSSIASADNLTIMISGSTYSLDKGVTISNAASVSNKVGKTYSGYIFFNIGSNIALTHSAEEYPTNASLAEALQSAVISANFSSSYKLKHFIMYTNSLYTTYADIIANRAGADIDIRMDADGKPYNAGTSGTLVYTKV